MESTFVCHATISRATTVMSSPVIAFSGPCLVGRHVFIQLTSNAPRLQTRSPRGRAARVVRCSQVVTRPKTDAKKPSAAPKLTANGDSLETTPLQMSLVATHFSLCAAVATKTVYNMELSNASAHVALVAFAYLFTDFAIGVYHHAVDNYGSAETPVFGCTFKRFAR